MKVYSQEFKESLVVKALSNKKALKSLAAEANVCYSSLYLWINKYKNGKLMKSNSELSKRLQDWTRSERMQALLESAHLSDEKLGIYCRKNGLYKYQLSLWKDEFMNKEPVTLKEQNKQFKAMKIKIKRLEQDKG